MNISGAVVLLLLTIQSAASQAIEVKAAIRAPVNCSGYPSCGDDISLPAAKASFAKYAEYLKRIAERDSSKSKRSTNVEESVRAGVEAAVRAVTQDNPGPVLFDHICGEAETQGHYHFWAPVERLIDGHKDFKVLSQLVQSGTISDGKVYVQTTESANQEQHFAMCNSRTIGSSSGPPTDCTTVAIITTSEIFLRAGNRNTTQCFAMATFRPSGAIQIDFNIETKTEPKAFAYSLATHLAKKYLLTTEQEITETRDGKSTVALVRTTAALRDSPILGSGWRESFDFDLWIREEESTVSVSGRANALVSRQAVGNLAQYTGLSDAQRNIYASALDSAVEEGIRAACKNYRRKDSKRLSCD